MWSASWLVLLLGCPNGGETDDYEPFDCELLASDGELPLGPLEDADAELILGFQGFLHVPLHVTSDDDPPERIDVAMTLDVDGFDRLGGQQPQVPFLDGYDEPVSRVVLFFLTSGNVGEWRDRDAHLVAAAVGEGRRCVREADIRLVDAVCDGEGCE
jgi:hypothetical protein